ncbi:phospholipid phosphatase 5-like isoform X2 [Rhinoraja longicauda]
MRKNGIASFICEIVLRLFLFGIFLISETLTPFHRVIHPEEMWLYKNPRTERDTVPTWHMFAISFMTPLMAILLMRVLNRTESRDVREGCLAGSLGLGLNGVITNTLKLVVGSCFCWPRVHCLLLRREAPLLHAGRPRERMEAVCDANAYLRRRGHRPVASLRLQAPLARCAVWLSDGINSGLHLLPPALSQPVGPRVPQAVSTDQTLSGTGAQACEPRVQTGCIEIHLPQGNACPVLSIVNLLSFYFQGNICTYL